MINQKSRSSLSIAVRYSGMTQVGEKCQRMHCRWQR